MTPMTSLSDAYKHTVYPIAGHGPRNVGVLKEALAPVDGGLESDIYGKGSIIENFQNKMASVLGKAAAVFFPSGTMAQQIALRIWCDRRGIAKVAYHPLCHMEIHEQGGLRELHRIESILLADRDRVIELDDVLDMTESVSALLLELPQREIGGQLPPYQTLESIASVCRERGIKLHLDGARLFEVLPHYQKTAAEICRLFDSVYISFYKGLGGIAGAILAGEPDFIEEATVWKRRHGGDLISLYPYILSADQAYDLRVHRMTQYYAGAKELAELFNKCHGVSTRPQEPVSNMFHVHFAYPAAAVVPILIAIYEETGIGFTGRLTEVDEQHCSFELSIGDLYEAIPKDQVHAALNRLSMKLLSLA